MADDAIDARQAYVLGDGPRIAKLTPAEMGERALAVHNRIRSMANRDLVGKTLETLPEIVPTLLRHVDLFEKHVELGIQFALHGALHPRDRELVTLRIGWLCQAPYEFGEHVFLARGLGFTDAEIAAVKVGSTALGWTPHERALLCAVEELFSNTMISDATWAALAKTLDEKQLIELPLLIGHYHQTAYLQNSIRLRLHPGNEGLKAG